MAHGALSVLDLGDNTVAAEKKSVCDRGLKAPGAEIDPLDKNPPIASSLECILLLEPGDTLIHATGRAR